MSSAFEKLNKKQQKSGGMSNAPTGGGRRERFDLSKHLDFVDVSDSEPHTGRIYPNMWASAIHWPQSKTKEGKLTSFPKPCLAFDPIAMAFDSTKSCPYCENKDVLVSKGRDYLQTEIKYYFNFLERDLQDSEPKKVKVSDSEAETGFKVAGSSSWTPMRVARVPKTMVEKCQKLTKIGMKWGKGDKSGPELSDPEKGRDIVMLYDSEADGVNKWEAHLADEKGGALTKKEKNYLLWDIETAVLAQQNQETYEEAEKEVERIMAATGVKKGKKSDSKGKGKSKAKATEFDIDELDDDQLLAFAKWLEVDDSSVKKAKKAITKLDEDDLGEKWVEFEEESNKPTKGKGKKDKSKSKDADEDEKPSKKKSSKKAKGDDAKDDEPAKKSKGKKSKDEDEDEKPAKGKSKSKKFSIDDDEDEDEKPSKKDKKGKKK